MKNLTLLAAVSICAVGVTSCGDSGSGTGPTPPPTVTTTSAPPAPSVQISTLLTVYRNASEFAEFTEGVTTDENIGKILLGVDELVNGTTVLDNETLRFDLQQLVERVNDQFEDDDFVEAFGETKQNLRRFFNDADNDGWSIDGRHGVGRDWPHDADGNDPDGWTSHLVITVSKS